MGNGYSSGAARIGISINGLSHYFSNIQIALVTETLNRCIAIGFVLQSLHPSRCLPLPTEHIINTYSCALFCVVLYA
ncbi:Protein of unknown function [Pyronema omphalodes CBS 100304]|uniref:Uncharacterized protein n=1 Tax=Pyronema omphalodes (strain CBS 100304) TaxID=1076935 RepID=U4L1H3_PYROM|nr:Protein of unknown function [Pyronema omphalodes CBS 100304]